MALAKKIGTFNPATKELSVNSLFKSELKPLFPGWTFV